MPNVSRRVLAAALSLACIATSIAHAQDRTPRRRPSSPLFASDTILHITLKGDWRALANDRDTVNAKLRAGTLSYVDSGGRVVSIPIHLATRGHFRLTRGNCSFPPLRVVFDTGGGTRRTLFASQRALKLGTHCNDNNTFDQYVLREYLADRAHTLVTDAAFKARLARVRYVDARDTNRTFERWGLFHESERELGNRIGGNVIQARGGRYADVIDTSAALLGIWEYFIGNTDFSMAALHNVRLVATTAGVLAVPYDFDFSGLVDTRYAAPDSRLPIKSVRQRLYRGPCLSEELVTSTLARFLAQRDAIRGLYEALAPLDRGYAHSAVDYIDDFYKSAAKPRDFTRMIRGSCEVGS